MLGNIVGNTLIMATNETTVEMISMDTSDQSETSDTIETSDHDYYDIEYRVKLILAKPEYIIALIIGSIALLANFIALLVVTRTVRRTQRQAAHYAFIMSLTSSDMLFSFSLMLFIMNRVFNPLYNIGFGPYWPRVYSRCCSVIFKSLNVTALNAELLSLIGMAIDHFLAITRPLHHTTILNKRRCILLIVFFWVLAFTCGFSNFIYILHKLTAWNKVKHQLNICEFVHMTSYQEEYTTFVTLAFCLVIMLFSYLR